MNPKYPIYIISKGRYESRFTIKALEEMRVPYKVVIEPTEYEHYSRYIDKDNIYVLPFHDLGQGSIPARNWVWEHAISKGVKRHWILDDNISGFMRLNRNEKVRVISGTILKLAEDFTERYTNVALSGLNYDYFVKNCDAVPPYVLNTRIYSCILIDNSLPIRWRGKYNEDTDLSLRTLKSGLCTILFNAFLCDKTPTLQMKGGNTDEVYIDNDNRMKFAKSLQEQHPDCVRVTWKFKRWHHQVDYSQFTHNILVRRKDYKEVKGVNNYGMKLVEWPIK